MTARRSNQSILKEINSEYSKDIVEAEAPILWPLDVKSFDSLVKTLMLGKMEGRKSW